MALPKLLKWQHTKILLQQCLQKKVNYGILQASWKNPYKHVLGKIFTCRSDNEKIKHKNINLKKKVKCARNFFKRATKMSC